MRSNEQFKELVYKRANDLNARKQKKRAVILRGVATVSLFVITGTALVYSGFGKRDANTEATADMIYECEGSAGSGYGNNESLLYYSLSDTCLAADGKEKQITEPSLDDDAYTNGSFSVKNEAGNTSTNDMAESVTEKSHLSYAEALNIAQSKCTIEYDSTNIYYDDIAETWEIVFFSKDTAGGCQTVYLSNSGEIQSIVYGE